MLQRAAGGLSLTANQLQETILWWCQGCWLWFSALERWWEGTGPMVQMATPRCPLRSWNSGHLWFGWRKHWRPARLSTRLKRTEIRGQGYSLDSGWDYWRPRGLHYLSQHHANRPRLRETEDLRWSAAAAAATAETIFVQLINRVLT